MSGFVASIDETRERQLIKQAQKGDTNAFENLALQYQKRIYNIALRMLNNPEDAADMTQEVLIKMYRALVKFRGDSAFSTWVYRITVNTCRDMLRRNYKHKENLLIDFGEGDDKDDTRREIADYSAMPEDIVLQNEAEAYLAALIAGLTPKYRMVVTLREVSGLGYQEIADTLQISLGTVKSRISRARKCMQEQVLSDAEQSPYLLRLIGHKEAEKNGLR